MTNDVWINRNQLERLIQGADDVSVYAYKPGQNRTNIRFIIHEKTGEIREIYQAKVEQVR